MPKNAYTFNLKDPTTLTKYNEYDEIKADITVIDYTKSFVFEAKDSESKNLECVAVGN